MTANESSLTVDVGVSVADGLYDGSAILTVQRGNANAGEANSTGANSANTSVSASAYNSMIMANDNKVIIGDGSTVGGRHLTEVFPD